MNIERFKKKVAHAVITAMLVGTGLVVAGVTAAPASASSCEVSAKNIVKKNLEAKGYSMPSKEASTAARKAMIEGFYLYEAAQYGSYNNVVFPAGVSSYAFAGGVPNDLGKNVSSAPIGYSSIFSADCLVGVVVIEVGAPTAPPVSIGDTGVSPMIENYRDELVKYRAQLKLAEGYVKNNKVSKKVRDSLAKEIAKKNQIIVDESTLEVGDHVGSEDWAWKQAVSATKTLTSLNKTAKSQVAAAAKPSSKEKKQYATAVKKLNNSRKKATSHSKNKYVSKKVKSSLKKVVSKNKNVGKKKVSSFSTSTSLKKEITKVNKATKAVNAQLKKSNIQIARGKYRVSLRNYNTSLKVAKSTYSKVKKTKKNKTTYAKITRKAKSTKKYAKSTSKIKTVKAYNSNSKKLKSATKNIKSNTKKLRR